MKTLIIRWQRLLIDNNQTCARCGSTEEQLEKAYQLLKQCLAHLDIDVVLEKIHMDMNVFQKAPLESNRILIADKPLEQWLDANVRQSSCCGPCGDAECRTLELKEITYEVIPESMIIKAGLLAAAEMIQDR